MSALKQVVVARVPLMVDDFLSDYPGLVYRCLNDNQCAFQEEEQALAFSGMIDFSTYLGSFSSQKWIRYTGISDLNVHFEYAGDACSVHMVACEHIGQGPEEESDKKHRAVADSLGFEFQLGESKMLPAQPSGEFCSCDMPLCVDNAVLSSFALQSDGTTLLRNVYYYVEVPEERIRPVEIALCTTTFMKEEYIIPNIERIKKEILASDDDLAEHFHMFVVDNGRSLDAEALSDDGVSVCPNDNVGGSGGFARGMLEALHAERENAFTHVILMDDDVRMLPESFKRIYALLRLTNEEYKDAFINGAMLELEYPCKQFEDVSFVDNLGGYRRIKSNLFIDSVDDVFRNETIEVERPQTYGAWWLSCIPVSAIREHGLPVPFFVRCDDVEYGLRCKARYMTMNGIMVWHARFETRFNAAVTCYQYVRNMLITIAVTGCSNANYFMIRFRRVFDIYMRTMNYCSADIWLDGLEGYLEGPEPFMSANAIEIIQRENKKAEKLVPLEELDRRLMKNFSVNKDWLDGDDERGTLLKVLETLPHDRHFFPRIMLRNRPGQVGPGASFSPWQNTAMRKHLVVVDATGTKGAIRTIDSERNKELHKRFNLLIKRYHQEHKKLEQAYRDAYPKMTSEEYWIKKLGL